MPQKRFKYFIQKGEETPIELAIDPKGWDGHEVGFDRTDDFGLNVQNVVPLSFSGVGRTELKGVYEANGIFGKTRTIIKKRMNDWTYAPFYIYKHDYSTYKDNLHYVEMSGLEDGLAKKFDTYKDTEYEIDLPTTGKTFIDYTGASYVDRNQIQCLAGRIKEKTGIGNTKFVLGGNRAVRAYSDSLAFTDSDGLPYQSMTVRALKTITFDLNVNMKCTISAHASFLSPTPASGQIRFIKHNASFSGATELASTAITASSSYTYSNNRVDTFDTVKTIGVTLNVGELLSVFYDADNNSDYNGDVFVDDGGNCYVEVSAVTQSAYQNAKLECFTYEWLIGKLLEKIDTTATFESLVTYPNVKELLTCTPCIRNMGSTNGTGKIKATLKDVLESFHKLKCIGIDIEGQKMTIKHLADFYPSESYGEPIKANNIVVEHDPKHQFNKIKVGADTEDREDDDPLIYPFICEKEFSVADTIADNELDLMNNFMLDPYAIDKYIRETLSEADNKDECEFAVMACKELYVDRSSINGKIETFALVNETEYPTTDNFSVELIIPSSEIIGQGTLYFNLFSSVVGVEYSYYVYFDNVLIDEYTLVGQPDGSELYVQSEDAMPFEEIKIVYVQNVEIPPYSSFNAIFSIENAYVRYNNTSQFGGYILYRDHIKPIVNFTGISETIYNIPLTPMRILERWKEYLAISLVGSTDKRLKFGTTTILNSGIISRCDYETADVVENADLILTGVTPTFLPTTISADTQENPTISDFLTKKYKYIKLIDEKTGNEYQGWTNSLTFAVIKNKSRQIMLQAKQI